MTSSTVFFASVSEVGLFSISGPVLAGLRTPVLLFMYFFCC